MEIESYSIDWWIRFILSIIPFTPLIIGIVKRKDKSHTFFTWLLYLILDCITLFSGLKNRAYIDPMLFGFSVCSLIMSSILFYQRKFALIGKIEMITIILIIICIIVWNLFGSYLALICSILSESIVGIYLIIQTFKYPRVKYNLIGYIGFLIVSILSIIFTVNWTIEEVGYAISETILNFIILIPLIKKWWKIKKYGIYAMA